MTSLCRTGAGRSTTCFMSVLTERCMDPGEVAFSPPTWMMPKHTGMFSVSPLLYYYLGDEINGTPTAYIESFIIDTSFQVVDSHKYGEYDGGNYKGGMGEQITPLSDGGYLLSSRFDKKTKTVLALTKFSPQHEEIAVERFDEGTTVSPGVIQTVVMDDGTIYFSYMVHTGGANRLALACLDGDLNLKWKQYFLEKDAFHWGTSMSVSQDGKVAVGSYYYRQIPGKISVVVVNDNSWGAPETEAVMRPYVFYPNPLRDRLSFHYSPDVKPQHVALCDLQGRELRVWRSGFESLDLSGLSAGTYMLRVTLKGGKSYSDLVIKE